MSPRNRSVASEPQPFPPDGRGLRADEAAAVDAGSTLRERALRVAELNHLARATVEEMGPLWVVGEISNLRTSAKGHVYFALRDLEEDAAVDCVLWRGVAQTLLALPCDGDRVRLWGRPTIYAPRGHFEFEVRRLVGDGEGWWQRTREALRAQLAAEGLLAPERKRPLPTFPRRLAVVTSRHGAAVHDVIEVVRRRAPWVEVLVVDTRVQGEDAADNIVRALRAAEAANPDVVVVTRGGGAREELWVFNDERVVRAVATLRVPVVCAIGHETDETLAELVADQRAPTPSAAAMVATPDGAELRRRLIESQRRLTLAMTRLLEGRRHRWARQRSALVQRCEERLALQRARLGERAAWLETLVAAALERRRQRLGALARHLDDLSPLRILGRGYGVPLGLDGRVLQRPEDFPVDGRWRLLLAWGRVHARTESVDLRP